VHSAEKSLADLGDKVSGSERAAVESAIADVREALKGDDRNVIETKATALASAAGGIAQKAYEQSQQGAGAGNAGGGAAGVMDAEFEEVKDDKGKAGKG
jgi:molecular chaperone DnaK